MQKMLVAVLLAAAAGVALAETPSREDCIPYDPAQVMIRDVGSDGWLLVRDDGMSLTSLQLLDTHADAEGALAVAKRFTAMCFIGRNNRRADHIRFVMVYWK